LEVLVKAREAVQATYVEFGGAMGHARVDPLLNGPCLGLYI
jgi:hypothetical protein